MRALNLIAIIHNSSVVNKSYSKSGKRFWLGTRPLRCDSLWSLPASSSWEPDQLVDWSALVAFLVQILNMFLRKAPACSDSRSPQQSQHMHAPRWQIGPFGEILFGTYSSSTEPSDIDTPSAFKHPLQSHVIVCCLPIPFHRWQVDVSSEPSIVSLAQAVALTQVRNYRDTQDEERLEPLLSDFFLCSPAKLRLDFVGLYKLQLLCKMYKSKAHCCHLWVEIYLDSRPPANAEHDGTCLSPVLLQKRLKSTKRLSCEVVITAHAKLEMFPRSHARKTEDLCAGRLSLRTKLPIS